MTLPGMSRTVDRSEWIYAMFSGLPGTCLAPSTCLKKWVLTKVTGGTRLGSQPTDCAAGRPSLSSFHHLSPAFFPGRSTLHPFPIHFARGLI